ncbi:MAG TPA: tetratricopeptide repeat protein [Flavobacterium sp.]|nr:tetratricopeptide repeat protein [Flavobacterium sp.]
MLKSIGQSKPADGRAAFLLGNVYLTQNIADSAKIYFQKGIAASDGAKLNYIGLGQIELDNGNASGAQSNFDQAIAAAKKKSVEEYVYIGKAYTNADKPDYKKAIEVLNKAKAINPTDASVQLALGDAYYGDKNQNEAYAAYRNAFNADNSLIRAKMQLGVLLKGAKAYTEAVKAYNDVIATDANYGPVYRELAETYYYWGNNEPKKYTEYIGKALTYYEKYMSLTDYSLTSRMRHADFLILAKDYKALEVEANKMKELDKVNPRILRYLGYSAYENGNIDVALKSLQDFISNPSNKVIARDYLYLGLAKLKKSNNVETKTVDATMFAAGVSDIKKSVEMEITMTNDLSEVGKKFYEQKLFKEAAAIYEIAVTNVNSKNFLLDNFYLGNSIYYDNTRKDVVKPDPIALQKADVAFGKVIEASPTTQDAYIFRARTNNLLENEAMTIKYYEDYLKVVTEKGPEEVTKNKAKFIESYNNIAANYANTDKPKAVEYLNKTLALDPANAYATEAIKTLGKK